MGLVMKSQKLNQRGQRRVCRTPRRFSLVTKTLGNLREKRQMLTTESTPKANVLQWFLDKARKAVAYFAKTERLTSASNKLSQDAWTGRSPFLQRKKRQTIRLGSSAFAAPVYHVQNTQVFINSRCVLEVLWQMFLSTAKSSTTVRD